jgi:hypothetical protein
MTDRHTKMTGFMLDLVDNCPNLFHPTNTKFLTMVRSGLITEGLGIELATRVANALTIDLSHINEDDDLVSQAAGQYAEYALKVYDKLVAMNLHKSISDAMIVKYFAHTPINF